MSNQIAVSNPANRMKSPRIKVDVPFASTAEIAELVRLFESCELPFERWTHRAHLAVAATYLRQYSLKEATDLARAHIQRYNNARGDGTGYHETITIVFMRKVAQQLGVARSLPELVNELADRFRVPALLDYYSEQLLWSAEAQATFVPPDLRPLDF